MRAYDETLDLSPEYINDNLKQLSVMKKISEQDRFEDFGRDINAVLTLWDIEDNRMARIIAGKEFIRVLKTKHWVRLGNKKHQF